MAMVHVEFTVYMAQTLMKKKIQKKNQNDKRRLGQLSGFLRSSNRRKESQLCSEEQHEYVH